ncbi:MAG: response regulator transcription factor [Microlunatus sp.]|nr:response regulator transcription factor [Microlunatus sp.]
MTRILIADDQALVRGGIAMLLSVHADLEVVGEASTGEEAIAQAKKLHPDVVIMDLRMPGLGGAQATQILTSDTDIGVDTVRVLVLTMFNDDESVYEALRAGASGFLVKDEAPEHLVQAVRVVADGRSWLDPTIAGSVIQALRSAPTVSAPNDRLLARLTPRETEILALMATGLSNAQISERLVLSQATTRTHVSRVLMKTGSRERTQAVVLAYQSGLVRPPDHDRRTT